MNPTLKGAARSWTMWFAIALAALGAVQLNIEQLRPLVSAEVFGWFNIGVGVVVAVLRLITTMSLAEKGGQ